MSYQVLARKWRPQNFEQMVGQAHVLRALINALDQGRLHHAYLFTGTRGVGKTTLARILAKCLNCETGVSAKPCGECGACREIDEGRFVDLIEVDAASRTKVEDTRELLENVQYAPTRGRYKVYLIDEVHMLSGHSFNALLKTLEEPPPHVKFLLATTDPQKLPVTILSRCLQFNLKRMMPQMIAEHLQVVLEQEGIPAEQAGLMELARGADGSMRDALSLLDQAIAFGGGEIKESEVREMLGAVPREHLHHLLRALSAADVDKVLQATQQLAEQAADFEGALADVISTLQRLALVQAVPGAIDAAEQDGALITELANQLSPETVQLYYQIALLGRRDLPLSPDPRGGFEMVMLRMLSFSPLAAPSLKNVQPRSAPPDAPAHVPAAPDKTPARTAAPRQDASAKAQVTPVAQAPAPVVTGAIDAVTPQDWPELVRALQVKGVTYALASNCSFKGCQDNEVVLILDKQHEQIRTKNAEQKLQQALADYFGNASGNNVDAPLKLRIEIAEHAAETPYQVADRTQEQRQLAAEEAIEADAAVNALKDMFGAKVIPGSIKPIIE